ncbi:hypothetical protein AXG93_3105s1430 [Marchantia polymorpha subsp. ruderalis]|uniref:Uncharacterized protein n=1 Tax=Marchantia polymorpha subsp. ruderalis TaxID=1480154 RepID=A0A176WLH7_MARPO|nr:hypothetical protein AXG93_3105s1430 [Marchantia polymorpha subsp. ruderalis]
MELGAPGDDQGVAAREEPASERLSTIETSTDLPAPNAHVPSGEHVGQRDIAAAAKVPTLEVCVTSELVLTEAAPSAQAPSAQGPSGQELFKVHSEEAPSALRPSAHIPTAEGRDAVTRVPSAEEATELPSAELNLEDLAVSTRVGSPTPLEMLAGQGAMAAAEEAMRPSARESPRISAAKEILEIKDDTTPEEEV